VITKGPLPEVDLTGFLVLPGKWKSSTCMVTRSSVSYPRHAPRPPFRVENGLARPPTDRCGRHGSLTTAWLAQSWSWEEGIAAPRQAEIIMQAAGSHCAPASD